MASCTVQRAEAPIESVTLVLTANGADTLLRLIGKHINGRGIPRLHLDAIYNALREHMRCGPSLNVSRGTNSEGAPTLFLEG